MTMHLRALLSPAGLALVCRLYLGGLFVYAAMYKINYAAEFAATIASYRLVPYAMVNGLAVVLPWVELVCGLLLVVGFRVRAAISTIGLLLVVFTLAIVVNLMRGAGISCGCFHTVEDPISWWTVARDLIWLAMAALVFRYDALFQLDRALLRGLKEVGA